MQEKPQTSHRRILVKELSERHRKRILRHFLALDADDRVLRFCADIPDTAIVNYVSKIDFEKDNIFGVFSYRFHLVGVGHLSYTPFLPTDNEGVKQNKAEFGISVSKNARNLGIGSALFRRAAVHCRNAHVITLSMHCLSSNSIMRHLAKKAGMKIYGDHHETDAYLKIQPANPASVLQEKQEEEAAGLDYALKSRIHFVLKVLRLRKKARKKE